MKANLVQMKRPANGEVAVAMENQTWCHKNKISQSAQELRIVYEIKHF